MQQLTPPYDDILDDETLAPLKRNHACLQCKKRKVKCDAVKPTCNPCLRSHAHALRSAQRNKSRPPVLVCTYTEGDDDDISPPRIDVVIDAERKRSSAAPVKHKRAAASGDKLQREKERRAVEEKDTLRARIAELEARIAALTTEPPAPRHAQPPYGQISPGSGSSPETNDGRANGYSSGSANGNTHGSSNHRSANTMWGIHPSPRIDAVPSVELPMVSIEAGEPGQFQSFDFSNLLVLPAKWPKNLPSPSILEHLIDVFFQSEPNIPRMIHRPTLLQRLSLGPQHPDFPFPGLLHAICSAAAPHTAWINNLKPDQLEEVTRRNIDLGLDLEASEDFGLAQAEAAERCIRNATMICMMGNGQFVFDMARAQLILTVVYLNKGMALRAWMIGAAARLVKALELFNRNVRKTDKPPLVGEPKTDSEREERLATVWLTYMHEIGFCLNASWSPSVDIKEIHVELPTSTDEFLQKHDTSGYMKRNPQTAHDADVLVNHPVPDPFVLVVKCALILGKVCAWLREWQQRVIKPGDELEGFRNPSFVKINAEIVGFQLSVPATLKNVYKIADSGGPGAFNVDLLSIHLLPNLAIILLHEPFVDWKGPETPSLRHVQGAFEAAVGFIHLIPSQLHISLIMSPLLAFSLLTIGKTIHRFIIRANRLEQYGMAMRWRTDIAAISNLLAQYGTKHAVGQHVLTFLNNYERLFESGVGLNGENCEKAFHLQLEPRCSIIDEKAACMSSEASSQAITQEPTPESSGTDTQSLPNTINGNAQPQFTFLSASGGMSVGGVGPFPDSAMSSGMPTTAPTPAFDAALLDLLDPAAAAALNEALSNGGSTGLTPEGMCLDVGVGAEPNLADLLANGTWNVAT